MQQSVVPLRRKFTFWLNPSRVNKIDRQNFEDELQAIASIETAQEFWDTYLFLQKPESMPEGTQLFLFQSNIKPVWEDENNQNGGRFIIRIKKTFGNKIWEELLVSFISDNLEDDQTVCGIVAHTKKGYIQISLWIKKLGASSEMFHYITKWIRSTIGMKEQTELEYILHPKDEKV